MPPRKQRQNLPLKECPSRGILWPLADWAPRKFTWASRALHAYLFFLFSQNSKNGPAEDEDDRRRPNHLHGRKRRTRQPQHAEKRRGQLLNASRRLSTAFGVDVDSYSE